jgi:hypothetical protein
LLVAETLVSAETAGPKSLLQREKDRKRGRNESPSPGAIFFLPLFFSPLHGRDLGTDVVLREERRRFPKPRRPGLRPLPGEGGTGWVDGHRDRRLVPATIYPSFSPLSRGETQGRAACFAYCGTLVSAETAGPKSLLQREKDRKRGWKSFLHSVHLLSTPLDLPSPGERLKDERRALRRKKALP